MTRADVVILTEENCQLLLPWQVCCDDLDLVDTFPCPGAGYSQQSGRDNNFYDPNYHGHLLVLDNRHALNGLYQSLTSQRFIIFRPRQIFMLFKL